LSERYDREEEPGRRGEERRRVARDDSAPRRVGEVREERGLEPDRGTSWTSVILLAGGPRGEPDPKRHSQRRGWRDLGSLGLRRRHGGGDYEPGGAPDNLAPGLPHRRLRGGTPSEPSGIKHGLLVALLALVVTLVLALLGGIVGLSFIDNLSNVTLPSLPSDVQGLGTILTVSGLLALLFPFIGGAIGGAWGARTGRRRP
jgi:hypothetical protein